MEELNRLVPPIRIPAKVNKRLQKKLGNGLVEANAKATDAAVTMAGALALCAALMQEDIYPNEVEIQKIYDFGNIKVRMVRTGTEEPIDIGALLAKHGLEIVHDEKRVGGSRCDVTRVKTRV